MVEKRGGTGVVLIVSGFMLLRSISIMEGSLVASPTVAAFQSGSSSKLNTKALSPVFSPPGQTTCFLHVATSMLVTGGEGHKGSFGVCLQSRCQGVPCWIVVHATQHHSSKQRCMANLYLFSH